LETIIVYDEFLLVELELDVLNDQVQVERGGIVEADFECDQLVVVLGEELVEFLWLGEPENLLVWKSDEVFVFVDYGPRLLRRLVVVIVVVTTVLLSASGASGVAELEAFEM